MWKQIAEFPIWKGLFWFDLGFFSHIKHEKKALMALFFFPPPCVQDFAGWLYPHPSGDRTVPGDRPLCRLPHAAWQHLPEGEGLVAFPLAYPAPGLQTGNTLAPDSRGLLAFSMWVMRLEVFDLLQDGGSQLVCPCGGTAPWAGCWRALGTAK